VKLLGRFDAKLPGPEALDPLVRGALEEDAAFCDRSVLPLPGGEEVRDGRVEARESGVLAGAPVFRRVFELVARPDAVSFGGLEDGDAFRSGQTVLTVKGPARALLSGERTALNFLQRLSGIATRTRGAVEAAGGRIAICDTRKTTPGLRALEKYAVVVGGGTSHRASLADMVMLKENHVALAGGIAPAVRAVRADPVSASLPLTIEVRSWEEAMEAAELGADRLLLDNMAPEAMRRIAGELSDRADRPELEASGGIGVEDLAEIASCGVDLASLGSLTHSVRAIDFSFLISGAG
jgi:nicotinate-nucleotide pyrophosphorylase (carboxylating)